MHYTCAITIITYSIFLTVNTALFQIRLQPIGNCEEWTVSYYISFVCMYAHMLSTTVNASYMLVTHQPINLKQNTLGAKSAGPITSRNYQTKSLISS